MERYCTLMYHDSYSQNKDESGFLRNGAEIYKISKEAFEEQVNAIADLVSAGKIEKDYVRFTFDDGGVSFYSIFAPILEKYHFKGIFFIATAYIGTNGFLSKSQIAELHERGHVIGGHSHHHEAMYGCDYETVKKDWNECLNILEDITGERIKVVSYPGGIKTKNIFKTLKELGVTDIYTSEPYEKPNHIGNDLKEYGRYGIKDSMTVEDVVAIVTNERKKASLFYKKRGIGILKKIMGPLYKTVRDLIYNIIKG